jgi:hypothetical protein
MTDYNNMPEDSRVWVYQASRQLTEAEIISAKEKADFFIEEWTAHGAKLKACFEIRDSIFLLMLVDEKQAIASGCSIDKSVHFILGLENELGISLTNRLLFAYRNNAGEACVVNRNEFERLIKTGIINDETNVFNTLVKNKSEFETGFEIPFEKSWQKNLIST